MRRARRRPPLQNQTKRNNLRLRTTTSPQKRPETPHLRSTPGSQPRQRAKIDRPPYPRRQTTFLHKRNPPRHLRPSPPLTGKDLTAYNEFTSSYLETLQPKGAVETQLANTCADLQFRLHRIAAAEHNLFALGHEENGDSIETGHPESHAALTFAETLRRSKDPIATITLYEQRLSRRFLQTLKQLREMQAERRALEQQQLDEMYIIARLHPSEAETIQPAHLGFVCSTSDWKQYLKRRILLESRQPGADKWPKPFNSRKFIRKVA